MSTKVKRQERCKINIVIESLVGMDTLRLKQTFKRNRKDVAEVGREL